MATPKTRSTTVTYSVAEVTVTTGRTSSIAIIIDNQRVTIPVPAELKAYFDQQFSRPNPSKLQAQKYATIMNLMRAAYLQGKKDGQA